MIKMEIPIGHLRLETDLSAKPRPIDGCVFVKEKLVVLITLENIKEIAKRIEHLERQCGMEVEK